MSRTKNCGRCNKAKSVCNCGRPTVITDEVLRKLEQAFSIGCSDLEACLFADIGKTALYDYQRKNQQFADRKELLKETPFMLARKTMIDSLKTDGRFALEYMRNKKRNEFSTQINNQDLDKNGEPTDPVKQIEIILVNPEDKTT